MKILRPRESALLALLPIMASCDYVGLGGKSDVEMCVDAQMKASAAEQVLKVAESEAQAASNAFAYTRSEIRSAYAEVKMAADKMEEAEMAPALVASLLKDFYGDERLDEAQAVKPKVYTLEEFFGDQIIPKEILDKATPEQVAQLEEDEARAEEAQKRFEEAKPIAEKAKAEARAWFACLKMGGP